MSDDHELTLEDRLAIEELYSRYAHAFDGGDADAWTALFTPEGRFVLVGSAEVGGEDALRGFLAERHEVTPGIRHITSNIVVEGAAGGARGRAYVLVLRLDPKGSLALRNFGSYEDELVRTDAGWRFTVRSFSSWLPEEMLDSEFSFGAAPAGAIA